MTVASRCRVSKAENGREALEKMRAGQVDLVLSTSSWRRRTDTRCSSILKASSELRGLPVIVISALDQMDSVTKCIELGAEGLSRGGSARAVKTS